MVHDGQWQYRGTNPISSLPPFRTKAQILTIMKDSRSGSYATMGGAFWAVAKCAAIAHLASPTSASVWALGASVGAGPAMVVAQAKARATAAPLLYFFDYVVDDEDAKGEYYNWFGESRRLLGLARVAAAFALAAAVGLAVLPPHEAARTLAVVAVAHAFWRDRSSPPQNASGADDDDGIPLTPQDILHARISLGLGAVGLVWWIVLQVRVWGTHACAAHEEVELCCEPGLYAASFWFLVSTYIVLGVGCCCTFAMLSFFAGALSGAVAAGAAANAAAEEAADSSTSRGSSMPDLQVRLLGKGEQV